MQNLRTQEIIQDQEILESNFEGSLSPGDKLKTYQVESFGTKPNTVVLKKGFILHRLIGKQNPIGAFWINHETFCMFMNDLKQLENTVKQHQNNIRNNMGLLTEWKNTLSRRIKVTLLNDVVAHKGLIGAQYSYVEIDSSKFALNSSGGKIVKKVEWRRGGHFQYVVPSIAKAEMTNPEKNGIKINEAKELFRMNNLHQK